MRRTAIATSLLSLLTVSCGASVAAPEPVPPPAGMPMEEGELVVRPDATDHPSLELRFSYVNEHSTLGWGAMHFWARPHHDHVSVTALLDAPSERARWQGCGYVDLRLDRRVERIPARYVGRPMEGSLGQYDAVQLDLDVLTLRKIVNARRVVAVACGDRFEITGAQRHTLGRFVEWFDTLAVPRQLRDAPWYREVGPDPELLPLEGDEEETLEG